MAIGLDGDRAPAARPRPAGSGQPDQLTTRLQEIAGSVASPEDALEPMARAIMEATGACAGAVCLYDVRLRLLRLAAEVGISDEGCRRLRIIRKGEPDAWEMPLHGLLNGRAYLIDNASQNRFVPPLIAEAGEMTTVVCLPLYSGQTPLASLILVAQKPRRFEERQLHAVEAPLREMARVIEAARRHAEGRSTGAPAAPRPTPPAGTSAGGRTDLAAPELASAAAALARTEQERDRLAAALEAAHAGDGARVAELRGELDRLRARLGEAEADVAHERSAREELETRFAGGASAGRQELQRAQSAVREAENARATALAEAGRLRAELERAHLDAAQAPVAPGEVDARVVELLAKVDQLRASLAEAEAGAAHEQRAREELEGRLAGGVNAGQSEIRKAVAAARNAERGRMAALAEAARLRSDLELARIEAPGLNAAGERDERIGPLLAEIDRLRARLAEAEAGAAHEHRARDELETRLAQGVTTSQQELRRAIEAARAADEARATSVAEMGRLRAELDRARSDAARAPGSRGEIDVRVVELAAEIDRLRTRVAEAEAGAAHQHRAREELETRLSGGVSSGQQELRKALEAVRQAEQERAAAVGEAARLGAELERARLAATETPEQIALATARWQELTTEIDRLHTRLAEAEAGAAHEHRAREAIETRLAELASGGHQELQQALMAVRGAEDARGAADAEVARLTTELREARAEAARLPELRSAAEAHAATLAADVDRLAARVTEAEAAAAEERRARAALEARLAAGVVHDQQARDEALVATLAEAREQAGATARAELARLTAELATAEGAAARSDALAAALDDAERTRLELTAALEAATAERADLACAAAEREEAQTVAHAAERDRLRARAADAEAAAAREQRARAALETAASADLGRRDEDLQAALEAARVAEEGRDHALAELTTLRQERDAARASAEHLTHELARHRSESARLAGEARTANEAREESVRLLDAARRHDEDMAARLTASEGVLARVQEEAATELAALRAQLARTASESDRFRALHAGVSAERDRLAVELEGATAASVQFEQALDGARAAANAQKHALTEIRARAEELAAQVAERAAELQAVHEARAADVAGLAARVDALTGEADRLREAQAAIGAERDRLAADLEGATAGKAHLERALEDALQASRAREQAAMDEAQSAAARLAEREAALRTLGERLAAEIATHEAQLGEIVAEADALRESTGALGAERDRLAADLQGAAAGKAHLECVLDATLEEARARAEDLRETRGRIWEMAAHLDETTRSLVTQSEASAHEIATLSGRVQALTTAAHDLRDAHAAAVAECDHLAADLQGATVGKAHIEDALKLALEESRTRDQEAVAHLETARAQLWNTAARLAEIEQRVVGLGEERRSEVAAFTARVESLEAEADRLREVEASAGAERDRLAASLEGTAAAKAHLEEALKEALDAARAREQDAAALLHETRSQAWATAARLAETERTLRALAEERATEVEALTARAAALGADADRLRETEAAAVDERDHLAAELAGVRAAHERLEQTLAESREREETVAVRLAAHERELEVLRADHASALAAHAAAVADAGASNGAEPQLRSAALRSERPEPADPAFRGRAAASSQPGTSMRASVGSSAAEPTSRVVAILDDDGAWNGVAVGSSDVVFVAPTEAAVRQLSSAWPGRMLVNLAAPGAFKALVTLRALGAPTRILGFIAHGTADRVLPLGVVEPASVPLAPDAIVAALALLAPAQGRVVTVGADVDALLSLRQALARQGMSVSLAWDGKQATDLLDMVRPHAVVTDLGTPHDACAVLARLAVSTPVPAAVLIDGGADGAAALPMVLNNPDVAARIVGRQEVFRILARADGSPPKSAAPKAASAAGAPRLLGAHR